MQKYRILIGGLEASYMQKLALYLKSRWEEGADVGISDEKQCPPAEQNYMELQVCIGTEQWMVSVKEARVCRIILTDRPAVEPEELFQYQSADKLYREIAARCHMFAPAHGRENRNLRQIWNVFTADASQYELTAVSTTWAELHGRSEAVLYIAMEECSCLQPLFEVERDKDLGDLILDLRKGKNVALEQYLGRVEHFDYLAAPENPMILHEMRASDVQNLMDLIEHDTMHTRIVFVVGNTCLGSELLFGRATELIHVSQDQNQGALCTAVWQEFIRKCLPADDRKLIRIHVGEIPMDYPGVHLICNWAAGEVGQQIMVQWKQQQREGASVSGI